MLCTAVYSSGAWSPEYQSGTRISYSSDYVTAGGIEAVCLVLVFPTLKMRLNLNKYLVSLSFPQSA